MHARAQSVRCVAGMFVGRGLIHYLNYCMGSGWCGSVRISVCEAVGMLAEV